MKGRSFFLLIFIFTSLFILIPTDLFSQENPNDFSILYFKRTSQFAGSACMSRLYLENQRKVTIGPGQFVEYKIFSTGNIMVEVEVNCPGGVHSAKQLELDLNSNDTLFITVDVMDNSYLFLTDQENFLRKEEKKTKKKRNDDNVSSNIDLSNIEIDLKIKESLDSPINNSTKEAMIGKGNGTGFLLSKNGFIVTNYHVIDNAKKISIRGLNGNMDIVIPGKVVLSDAQNDLAIIKPELDITISQDIPFDIRPNSVETGENLFVLGYPFADNMGYEVKLTNGIVSSKSGYEGSISSFQLSAPVSPGNSGGPVFDDNGSLIGIVFAKHTMASNAGYAIKTNYLKILWDMLDNAPALPSNNTLKGLPLNEQINLLHDLVLVIEVEK